MIPVPTSHLRDRILTELRARGFDLDEYTFRLEQDRPVLRFRLGPRVILGCHVILPGLTGHIHTSYAADFVAVHGSDVGLTKSWSRKRDGDFDIAAVADHLVGLIEQELLLPKPELNIPSGTKPAASGLHVIHLAAVQLGALAPDSRAEQLLERIGDVQIQERIHDHVQYRGLTGKDMKALGNGNGLYLYRTYKFACELPTPVESIGLGSVTILKLGKGAAGKVETRFVLVIADRGNEIDIADPVGRGLTRTTPSELTEAWKLGGIRGKPWIGYASKLRYWDSMSSPKYSMNLH